MKKRSTAFILSFILTLTSILPMLAFSVSAFGDDITSNYYLTQYSLQSGLPDETVYDIASTADGIIWLATESGLVKYNSYSFEKINKNKTELKVNSVTDLFVDSKDRLWLSTNDNGAVCKTGNEYTYYNVENGAPSNAVRDITELSDGTIVIATSDGIFSVGNDGAITVFSNESGIAVQADTLARNKNDDNIVCVTSTGNIVLVRGNRILASDYDYNKYGRATAVCNVGADDYYVGTQDGKVYHINDYELLSTHKTGCGYINRICLDNDGNYWVIGKDSIGYINSQDSFCKAGKAELKDATDMFVDFQGNYWFSSSKHGLIELSKSCFTDYSKMYSLENTTANCIINYNNYTYIGTKNGLIILNEETGERIDNDLVRRMKGVEITDLDHSFSEKLLISTAGKGVFSYSRRSGIKQYTVKDGLYSNTINTLTVMADKHIIVGFDDGISVAQSDNVIRTVTGLEGIAGNVLSVADVPARSLCFIGTESNGAYSLSTDATLKCFNDVLNNITGTVKGMLLANDGKSLWLGAGTELYYVSPEDSVKEVDKLDLEYAIVDILRAPDGKMWIITSNSIVVVNENSLLDGTQTLDATQFNSGNGLISNINNHSYNYISDDGRLYLCTDNGILSIDTTDYKMVKTTPKLSVGSVVVDDSEIPVASVISLNPDMQKLQVNVSAISYLPYDEYNIRYKLSGQDDAYNFIEAKGTNEIVYTNIPGGKYSLQIDLISLDGRVFDSVTIEVTKEYSYFEQIMFKALIVFFTLLLVILFTYFVIFIKTRRNIKKHKRLQEITQQSMLAFAKVIDAKDPYTKGHSERVARYSVEIARRYGVSPERLEDIYYSALLHDIGKIGIPDEILKKPGKLTDEEYECIKTHTLTGAEILSDITAVKNVQFGARDHHEKYDGTGYPRGLQGTRISFEGRVVGAADAYDAMATTRGYNNAYGNEHIKEEIMEQSGKQFDPKIAEIIVQMIDDGFFDNKEDESKK